MEQQFDAIENLEKLSRFIDFCLIKDPKIFSQFVEEFKKNEAAKNDIN